jgi:hypothetical protein
MSSYFSSVFRNIWKKYSIFSVDLLYEVAYNHVIVESSLIVGVSLGGN